MTLRLFKRVNSMLTRPQWRGQVDRCDAVGLSGWAFAPGDPWRRLVLRVYLEQDAFQLVRADRYRADVHKADIAHDGYCGFHVPGRRLGGRIPRRIVVDGTEQSLPWARRDVTKPGQETAEQRIGNVVVELDLPHDRHALTGAVVAPDAPDNRRVLRLETNDGSVATTRACLFRPRSGGALADDLHGFAFAIPAGTRSFRLIDDEHGTVLHQSGGRHAHRVRR